MNTTGLLLTLSLADQMSLTKYVQLHTDKLNKGTTTVSNKMIYLSLIDSGATLHVDS